ncbi:hypothetical protein BH11PSE11_BH11PSE11_06770 [soil metagenome]
MAMQGATSLYQRQQKIIVRWMARRTNLSQESFHIRFQFAQGNCARSLDAACKKHFEKNPNLIGESGSAILSHAPEIKCASTNTVEILGHLFAWIFVLLFTHTRRPDRCKTI